MAAEVNRIAVRALLASEPTHDSEQEVLACVLFARVLTHFEATILLAERGMAPSAKAMLRVLCEAVFNLGACANDPAFHEDLLKDDDFRRARLIEALLELPFEHVPISTTERTELTAEAAKLRADAKAAGNRRLGVASIANKAGLLDYYRLIYVPYSGPVHSSVRDLDSHVEGTPDGRIDALTFGPDPEQTDTIVEVAFQLLLTAMLLHLKVMPQSDVQRDLDRLWATEKLRLKLAGRAR
jgi:hypothetical protein